MYFTGFAFIIINFAAVLAYGLAKFLDIRKLQYSSLIWIDIKPRMQYTFYFKKRYILWITRWIVLPHFMRKGETEKIG